MPARFLAGGVAANRVGHQKVRHQGNIPPGGPEAEEMSAEPSGPRGVAAAGAVLVAQLGDLERGDCPRRVVPTGSLLRQSWRRSGTRDHSVVG